MLTNTLTNKTTHQHRVAKSHSARNHAGKNTQAATAKMNLFLLTLWRHMRVAGYSSTRAYHQHYLELSCRIHIPAALPQGKSTAGNSEYEAGWIPELMWTLLQKRNIFRSCWESIHGCFVVQPVDSLVYRLHSPVSRTYIFVFRTMCLNRNGHCPSPWFTQNKTFWNLQKCRVWTDSTCWTTSRSPLVSLWMKEFW